MCRYVKIFAIKSGDGNKTCKPFIREKRRENFLIYSNMYINSVQEGDMDYESELKQLQQEGEMPLDDLLASLPPGMLEDQPPTPPVKGTSLSTKDATEKREMAKDTNRGQESSDLTSRRSRKRYLTD